MLHCMFRKLCIELSHNQRFYFFIAEQYSQCCLSSFWGSWWSSPLSPAHQFVMSISLYAINIRSLHVHQLAKEMAAIYDRVVLEINNSFNATWMCMCKEVIPQASTHGARNNHVTSAVLHQQQARKEELSSNTTYCFGKGEQVRERWWCLCHQQDTVIFATRPRPNS